MINISPTYIINLIFRPERRQNVLSEFLNKPDFEVKIINAIYHKIGAISLWQTIRKIVQEAINLDMDYILICEDDHQFTKHYKNDFLYECINEAQRKKADLLSGGVSWFKTGIQISENLFWVEKFSGLQFTFIFRKLYQKILDVKDFGEHDAADYKLASLTDKKFIIHPYLSVQKDFGYSDVTVKNNLSGRVEKIFAESAERLELLKNIKKYYTRTKLIEDNLDETQAANIIIPLYSIIERATSKYGCLSDKINFEQTVFKVAENDMRQKWETLCQCIRQAQINNDNFILITFDQINISPSFKKSAFLNTIISANNYYCDILLGNIEAFNHAVPVTDSLFWVDSFSYSSLIVLFSSIFDKVIMSIPLEEENIYSYLSYLTSNKLALYPFIADIKTMNIIKSEFQEKGDQLSIYRQVYQTYVKL